MSLVGIEVRVLADNDNLDIGERGELESIKDVLFGWIDLSKRDSYDFSLVLLLHEFMNVLEGLSCDVLLQGLLPTAESFLELL